ncbi:hypothetical protein [Alkaliphilus transvaalensis]|uniref:hypothetical protein n=1 Tax=Alkaliphilus transvaalensis TaxID=114628 RepID=UPI0012EC7F1F|nr:hypothetical protein [Alkaliphilus transvaalensis]
MEKIKGMVVALTISGMLLGSFGWTYINISGIDESGSTGIIRPMDEPRPAVH